MGVYIKGIEMPKNCFDCEIFGLCSLKDRLEHIEDRNPDCPLQPIDDEKVEKTQREIVEAWKIFRSVIKDEKL